MIFMHVYLRHVHSHRVCVRTLVGMSRWGFVCNMDDSLVGLEVSSRL